MRTSQVERRKRTRHLIELGGLVVKAGIVDLTGDDRAMIYGALLWMAEKLNSEQGNRLVAFGPKRGSRRSKRNVPKRSSPSLRNGKIGHDRWRAARRPQYRSVARHRFTCRETWVVQHSRKLRMASCRPGSMRS